MTYAELKLHLRGAGLCLKFFSPDETLANFVHIFIRRNAPGALKATLRDALYSRSYEGASESLALFVSTPLVTAPFCH